MFERSIGKATAAAAAGTDQSGGRGRRGAPRVGRSKRRLRRGVPVRTLGALLLLGSLASWASAASAANVVLVMTDDAPAQETAHMRTLQEIARAGATFTRAYTPTPICVPARATIQSGLYRQRHGVVSNGYQNFVRTGAINRTFAVALKNAGFTTSLVGKYLNGAPSSVPGWTSFIPHIGGGLYYHYELRVNGTRLSHGHAPADYSTDVFKGRLLTQIRAAVNARRPFFAMVGMGSPHYPSTPAPRHVAVPGLNDRQRTLLAVDETLEALMDLLRSTGQLDQTYVVLTSDHGLALGRAGARLKGVPYEGSIRVPLVVRGPGVPAGATLEHVVNLADLAPTFLEWMGAPAMDVDGRSFARLLGTSPPSPQSWRQATPIAHTATDSAPGVPSWRGVRTTRYAYVKYEGGATEVYDMVVDPSQRTNIAAANPSLTSKLASLADALASCVGASCRALEDRGLNF